MILTDEERALLAHEMVKGCKSVNWLASRLEAEVLRKLRDRPADAWMVGDEVFMTMAQIKTIGELAAARPLHIIPEANE